MACQGTVEDAEPLVVALIANNEYQQTLEICYFHSSAAIATRVYTCAPPYAEEYLTILCPPTRESLARQPTFLDHVRLTPALPPGTTIHLQT